MHMHIQAAEGLHYGIVPYVSRPALGIVSGMVSARHSLPIYLLLLLPRLFLLLLPLLLLHYHYYCHYFLTSQVSAGGNLGAVVLLGSFFEDGTLRLDEGFLRLGMVVCGLTTLLVFVYFPDHGSMLLRARALGARYDPQLIKPPSDYRGADSVRMFVLGQVLVMGQ